jgi:maltose alpha-D-glucosyltransferase/alpha-amylase
VLADREYPDLDKFQSVEVSGYGYRWIRLRRYS